METSREYPPRFILTISGVNAKKDVAVAEVAFSGGSCPLSIELVLSKPGMLSINFNFRCMHVCHYIHFPLYFN